MIEPDSTTYHTYSTYHLSPYTHPLAIYLFHHQQHRNDHHECCSPQQTNTLYSDKTITTSQTQYTNVYRLARPTWNRTLIILKSTFVVEYMFCIIFHSKFINLWRLNSESLKYMQINLQKHDSRVYTGPANDDTIIKWWFLFCYQQHPSPYYNVCIII